MPEVYRGSEVAEDAALLCVATTGLPMSSSRRDSFPVEPHDGQTRYRTLDEPRVIVVRVRIRDKPQEQRSPLLISPPATLAPGFQSRRYGRGVLPVPAFPAECPAVSTMPQEQSFRPRCRATFPAIVPPSLLRSSRYQRPAEQPQSGSEQPAFGIRPLTPVRSLLPRCNSQSYTHLGHSNRTQPTGRASLIGQRQFIDLSR